MLIRYGRLDDLTALAQIEALCFPPAEAASPASLRGRLETFPKHFWLLETESGEVVSFVNGMVTEQRDLTDALYDRPSAHTEQGAWQMIFGVDTLPQYRRQGYAARLLARAIEDAKMQGRTGLVLTCKDHLVPYYSRFGFVNEGVSDSTHGGAVWNQMRLTF